ncbi:MAG: sugar kinase [Anaerolineae bacterium]|nr:sugar kinase [Anaerolineae bacterium]
MLDVTAFGEALLRLSVPAGVRLDEAATLDVYSGGAEANVIAALARLGWRGGYVTALPDSATGRRALGGLRAAGADLSRILWRDSGRVGLYYVEHAAPPRGTAVIYDRRDSCAAQLAPADVDWDYLLGARLLHVTGITPALSESCRALTAEAITRARQKGIAVSFDVNYRVRLWTADAARQALWPLMRGVDVLFCKADDARLVFGLAGEPETVIAALAGQTGAPWVIMTRGEAGALAWDSGARALHRAEALPVAILDRIGAGDAFAAGVLHGWLHGADLPRCLRYGVTLAALKLSQYGDSVSTNRAELDSLVAGQGGALLR